MALEAQLRLLNLQQLLCSLAVVNAMATDATHIVLAVSCALEIRMLPLMAAQAPRINLLRRCLGGVEDLCDIPSTIHVSLARSMAAFARDTRLSMHFGQLGVRIRSKSLCRLFMARRACLLTDKISWSCSRRLALRRRIRSLC